MSKTITLPISRYMPRDYQIPMWSAFELGYKFIIALFARRSGKDLSCLSLVSTAMMESVETVFYMFPTRMLAEKAMWTGKDNDGNRILDIFPKELILHVSNKDMRITLINGSTITFVGSDTQTLVGTNPTLVVMSEFFLCDFEQLQLMIPILQQNGGRAILNGTIRGKNKAFDLVQNFIRESADDGSRGYCVIDFDVRTTKQATKEELQELINVGLMDYRKCLREFYNIVLDEDEETAVFKMALEIAMEEDRVKTFPHNTSFPVYCMMDLGVADDTTIIFFQHIKDKTFVIDYFESRGKDIGYYGKRIRSMYDVSKIFLPWDGNQRGKVCAKTAQEILRGMEFKVVSIGRDGSVKEGLERTKIWFKSLHIDTSCRKLLQSVEKYNFPHTIKNKLWTHAVDNLRGISKIIKDNYIRKEDGYGEVKSDFQKWLEFTDPSPTPRDYIFDSFDRTICY